VDVAKPSRVRHEGKWVAATRHRLAGPPSTPGPALARAKEGASIIVIDEVARMELASKKFVGLLDGVMECSVAVVATVHVYQHPVTNVLLRRTDVEVVEMTEGNRDRLPGQLFGRLTAR
jgi:nucleoside-triphosphatase